MELSQTENPKLKSYQFLQLLLAFVFWILELLCRPTMNLDMKIEANDQGFFVVKIFNEVNPEKNLTETNVKYIFSKFGVVSEIKYAQNGWDFISYKEK